MQHFAIVVTMAKFTSIQALVSHQKAQIRRLKYGHTSIDAACKASAEIGLTEAKKLTSGAVRTKTELATAGHPFRKQRLLGIGNRIGGKSLPRAYPLLPIGRQKNRVQNGWRIFKQSNGVYRLQNIHPNSKFVLAPGGTKKAVDRGFWVALNRVVVPKVRKARLQLLRTALKG